MDSPLITFADELPEEAFEDREFDVFISHATEDKEQVVRPLAHALKARGIDTWYDEFELRVGDSLRRKIDQGIARSRFGLVVLSPAFFEKNWLCNFISPPLPIEARRPISVRVSP